MSILIKDVTKSFGNPPIQVLKGVSAEIKSGEMLSITGRSGSGKSTLLYIISALDKPTTGDVIIDETSLVHISKKELHYFRNKKMGFVFQFHHLLPELTAIENVLMPTLKVPYDPNYKESAMELLTEFGIGEKANRFPGQLSGGEQQRVAIARALIMKPEIIFADEPTGNLDSVSGNVVMNLFRKVNQSRGTTIIYVTHDEIFSDMASRKITLVDGKIAGQE